MYNHVCCFFFLIHFLREVYFSEGQMVCVKIVTFFMAPLTQVADTAKIIWFVLDSFFEFLEKGFVYTGQWRHDFQVLDRVHKTLLF